MYRAQRNVPVYLKEQQQAEEKAQEKLLVFQEQQRVKQHMDEQEVFVCKLQVWLETLCWFSVLVLWKNIRIVVLWNMF